MDTWTRQDFVVEPASGGIAVTSWGQPFDAEHDRFSMPDDDEVRTASEALIGSVFEREEDDPARRRPTELFAGGDPETTGVGSLFGASITRGMVGSPAEKPRPAAASAVDDDDPVEPIGDVVDPLFSGSVTGTTWVPGEPTAEQRGGGQQHVEQQRDTQRVEEQSVEQRPRDRQPVEEQRIEKQRSAPRLHDGAEEPGFAAVRREFESRSGAELSFVDQYLASVGRFPPTANVSWPIRIEPERSDNAVSELSDAEPEPVANAATIGGPAVPVEYDPVDEIPVVDLAPEVTGRREQGSPAEPEVDAQGTTEQEQAEPESPVFQETVDALGAPALGSLDTSELFAALSAYRR